MTQLRDMENNHHEKVTEQAVTLLEQIAKNQVEEELHDDLKVVSKQVTNYSNIPSLIDNYSPSTSYLRTRIP